MGLDGYLMNDIVNDKKFFFAALGTDDDAQSTTLCSFTPFGKRKKKFKNCDGL